MTERSRKKADDGLEYAPDETGGMDRENVRVLVIAFIFGVLTFITFYGILSGSPGIDAVGVAFFFAVMVFIVSGSVMGYRHNKESRAEFSDSRLRMDKDDPTADPYLSGYYGIDSKRR
ncbi:MAG: hypothetical protein AB1499_17120 [Nitrospirota bacterium]